MIYCKNHCFYCNGLGNLHNINVDKWVMLNLTVLNSSHLNFTPTVGWSLTHLLWRSLLRWVQQTDTDSLVILQYKCSVFLLPLYNSDNVSLWTAVKLWSNSGEGAVETSAKPGWRTIVTIFKKKTKDDHYWRLVMVTMHYWGCDFR